MEDSVIRNFNGQIIAKIEYQGNGDKIVRNFYGQILGKYDKACDVTRDFYGRIVAKGDCVGLLIKQ